jgi:hypothetical protein
MRKSLWWLLAAAFSVFAQDPVLPTIPVNHVSPVVGELSPPESLRPCCAIETEGAAWAQRFRRR